jgi:hypothetical protein
MSRKRIHPDLEHSPEDGRFAECTCGCKGHSAKLHDWSQSRTGPHTEFPSLDLGGGHRLYQHRCWMDHCYRLRLPSGKWRYVAEPYGLNDDALEDLVFLSRAGWDVSITAWQARHYPGHTLAVVIEKED